ncbi:oxidoreductase domain-containing protein [Streptomyces albus]|uniref:Oxidoreductase domain-containing protein n=1 Tax=Streptomyces albus (strain ATCC 21838 / DSM 41398 / FERM P-419 / JCM 4703 / NBRC 107858) TaxID=1081613 RepID=A0A0B5EG89_STRA4|nr:oxidoreductase domain-containing protein [Streptomyces albus]AOU75396.1 oxidoreductase domain-containing protein [Streptomyces albus]AYN31201.1 oxidoreductase domain-containing protein [Streptomyces albus]
MSAAAERPLRLGALGHSSIAWRRVLPTVARMPGLDLVAVAGRTPQKAARFAAHFGCAAEEDGEALLARPDVDAVYISTPTSQHHRWAERALNAGKHVLVEKPIGVDAREAEELCALAEKQGLVLRENFMFLHHTQHEFAAKLAASGRLGRLASFQASFSIPPLPKDDIRYDPDLGGGALLDVGVYPLRAASLLLGPELRVAGASLRTRPDGLDLAGQVLLVSGAGVLAELSFGFEHAYASAYTLWSDRARLTVTRAFTPPPGHRPEVILEEQDHEERFSLPACDQLAACLHEFAESARHGGPAREHRPAGAVATMELVDAVRARAVEVPVPDPGEAGADTAGQGNE